MLPRLVQFAALFLVTIVLGACATSNDIVDDASSVHSAADPWENVNRGVYAFNDGLDRLTLKPLSKAYKWVTPKLVRRGIANFFVNLRTPLVVANDILQGKGRQALGDTGRLLFNSTIGIGGSIDVAERIGLEPHDEDFGQTLAAWGVPNGPYLMVPFLGPRTLRDALTTPLDLALNPLFHYENASVRDKILAIEAIQQRSKLSILDDAVEASHDPYITIRETYLQNRRFLIHDGSPPEGDDDLFDEFTEEE